MFSLRLLLFVIDSRLFGLGTLSCTKLCLITMVNSYRFTRHFLSIIIITLPMHECNETVLYKVISLIGTYCDIPS
jgi:hypothetical protein